MNHQTENLRIVLLGYNESGKSSSGNTILGRDVFDLKKHAECVKKEGVVAGRNITVIDTPGRLRGYGAQDTPKLYQNEVVRSATLCPPGPHVFLLVVNIRIQFEEPCKDAVREHLQHFGERVWNHIIVLFTNGDQLEDMDIQQHIIDEGEPLQWLLDKCGNRFHVFNNKVKDDSTQVAELLKKIDEMVTGNQDSHFELDNEKLRWISQKQREYEESKRKREQQDCENTKRMGNEHKLTEQRIILVGSENAGKTSAMETILNSMESDSLKTTLQSAVRKAKIGRWQVTVVDTPGWLRDAPRSQTPKRKKLQIVKSASRCPPRPHAFLLILPACTAFTEADETAINEHLELLGEKVWNHTIVVFTCADWTEDSPIELYIVNEGEPLRRILEKCGNRYHALSNLSQHGQGQVETLLEKIEMMVAGNGSSFYETNEQIHMDMANEGPEDETEDATGSIQLPSDPEEVLGQKRPSCCSSTIGESSGYITAASSQCCSTDSAQGKRPPF